MQAGGRCAHKQFHLQAPARSPLRSVGAPCRSNTSRALAAADGLATKHVLLPGSAAPAPPSGDRGVSGRLAASPASIFHLCTSGEVVAAQRKSSLRPTARRTTGRSSQASSSLTRLASRVLQAGVDEQQPGVDSCAGSCRGRLKPCKASTLGVHTRPACCGSTLRDPAPTHR